MSISQYDFVAPRPAPEATSGISARLLAGFERVHSGDDKLAAQSLRIDTAHHDLSALALKVGNVDVGTLAGDVRIAQSNITALDTAQTGLRSEVLATKQDVGTLRGDIDTVKSEQAKAGTELADIKQDIAALKKAVEELQKRPDSWGERLAKMERHFDERLDGVCRDIKELRQEVDRLKSKKP